MAERKRHDVGETHDERIHREDEQDAKAGDQATKVQRKTRADLVVMAALLIAVVLAGWWRTDNIAGDNREASAAGTEAQRLASIDSCERQNKIARTIRHDLRDEIEGIHEEIAADRQLDPSLFPDISPAEFETLIGEGIERDRAVIERKRNRIDRLPPLDCEAKYAPVAMP